MPSSMLNAIFVDDKFIYYIKSTNKQKNIFCLKKYKWEWEWERKRKKRKIKIRVSVCVCVCYNLRIRARIQNEMKI